jgi:SAM-dependent methyltransferase
VIDGDLARLRSLLDTLPAAGLPRRVLNVGCGAFPCAQMLHDARPGWALFGLDVDGTALRRALRAEVMPHLVQADAAHLPDMLRTQFGLILVRHPDLHQSPASWDRILPVLPGMLAPGGALLVTLYNPEEAARLRAVMPAPRVPDPATLAPVDLAGHDRLAFVFEAAKITPLVDSRQMGTAWTG